MRHFITKVNSKEDRCTFNVLLRIPLEKGWIDQKDVKFYVWRYGGQRIYEMKWVKNDRDYAYFETIVELESCPLYHYYFSFIAGGKFQYYKDEKKTISGSTTILMEECFKMSVNFDVPEWAKGAVCYQIFPDRFNKGKGTTLSPMPRRRIHKNWSERPIIEPDEGKIYNNDFFGGNFRGIMEKIPYIASLGVEIVYFNPIVRSQSTHRYDTADYFQPDPYLGTVEELKEMINEFHRFGIKVVFDGVFNHTGNDSVYFNQYGTYDSVGAYQSIESPYRDFYNFDENGKVDTWWGNENMPNTNKNNSKFIDMICDKGGVIDVWCSWGMDALRLDVIEELPFSQVNKINRAMQRNRPNNFIIYGEVWENPMRKKNSGINIQGAHTVMNYFENSTLLRYYMYGETGTLQSNLREMLVEYPVETLQTLMNATSTHDTSRCIEFFCCNDFMYHGKDYWDIDWDKIYHEEKWKKLLEEEKTKCKEKGLPEEKAYETVRIKWQENYRITKEQYEFGKMIMKSYLTAWAFLPGTFTIFYGDEVGMQGIGNLLNRATYPWGHEDLELLDFYKKLIKSRKSEEFLRKADMRVVKIDQEQFIYERYDDEDQIIVIASRANNTTSITMPEEYKNGKIVFSNGKNSKNTLAPYGAIVIKK